MKGGGTMPAGKHVLGQGKNRVFGTAKVGDRGQIVIPQEARRFYGISPGDTLLILGNEASGLPDAFAQMGVSTLIPHSHQIDSLNLAIAAGIGMYAFTRR